MEEVGEAGYRKEEAVSAQKVKLDSFAERIGLGGLNGEEHSKRAKVGVNGHVGEREMHYGVEAGRRRSELAHAQKKTNQAVQKASHNMAWSKAARFKDVRVSNIAGFHTSGAWVQSVYYRINNIHEKITRF